MNTRHLLTCTLLALLAGWLPGACAQAPQLIHIQGKLVDQGALVNGQVAMELRLYNAETSGTLLYADSTTITVVDGLYSTYLGDHTTTGSLTNALKNSAVYLEVVVDGSPLSPRERLASVPYALGTSGGGDSALGTNIVVQESTKFIGVGTTTPLGRMEIRASPLSVATLVVGGRGGYSSIKANTQSDGALYIDGSSVGCKVYLNAYVNGDVEIATGGGNVGIGRTPSERLDVAGTVRCTSLTLTSDRRLKQDVQPLDQSLETVTNLNGVRYRWRRDAFPDRGFDERSHIGLIAQDVARIVPEAVITDPDGEKSVDYPALIPFMIEAIKSQQVMIETQRLEAERQRAEFEKQLAAQELRIQRLLQERKP